MDWRERLRREAKFDAFDHFDLLYHVSLWPIVPPEYHVDGIAGLTFRLRKRAHGGHLYVTTIDAGAVARLGERWGLPFEGALVQLDSHERVHVALQLDGVAEEDEERFAHVVDAVLLSILQPRVEGRIDVGAFGLVRRLRPDFWEGLGESSGEE